MRQFALCKRTFEEIILELTALDFLQKSDINRSSSDLFYQFLHQLGKETLFQPNGQPVLAKTLFYDVVFSLLHYSGTPCTELIQAFSTAYHFPIHKEETLSTNDLITHFYYILLTKSKTTGLSPFEEALAQKTLILNQKKQLNQLVVNGKTQPIFDRFISERVFVETDLDTDEDGKKDRIAVYIQRPKVSKDSYKIPVIYTANPYAHGCLEERYDSPHPVDCKLNEKPQINTLQEKSSRSEAAKELVAAHETASVDCRFPFPELETMGDLSDYFLPRGFAKVVAGGIGTKNSDGFRTCGSPAETASTIAVIEWLTGARKAFTTRSSEQEVVADWCSGKVAMTGKSYLGTLAIAAATSGVSGLKTIIPEAAISNWYDYYRENGVLSSALGWQGDDADLLAEYCFSRSFEPNFDVTIGAKFQEKLTEMRSQQHRDNGLYNDFWHERNYLKDVGNISASVFAIHGLNDWNVKPKQVGTFWNELQKHDVHSKLLLHQGDHVYINHLESIDFYDIVNLWLTQELYEIDNGASTHLPSVFVQSNTDINDWQTTNYWETDQQLSTIRLNDTTLISGKKQRPNLIQFVDDPSTSGFSIKQNNANDWQHRLITDTSLTNQLRVSLLHKDQPIRLSGTASLRLALSLNRPTAIVSAMLVDYGSDYRYSTELVENEKVLFYDSEKGSIPLVNFKKETRASDYKIITRGHLNASVYNGNTCNQPLNINQFYTHQLTLHPCDYQLKANHSLGLIIYGMDMMATQRPSMITEYTVDLENSWIQLPLYF